MGASVVPTSSAARSNSASGALLRFGGVRVAVEAGFDVGVGGLNGDDADVERGVAVARERERAGDLQIADHGGTVGVIEDAGFARDQDVVAVLRNARGVPCGGVGPRAVFYGADGKDGRGFVVGDCGGKKGGDEQKKN